MPSLIEIVSSLSARADQPFNVDLQEELKHIVNYKRANYTQQFLEKNPYQRKQFLQQTVVKLEKVPKDECVPIEGCVIMRTKCEVPQPIRSNHMIFDFVGDSNFMNGYSYQDPAFIQDVKFNRFTQTKPKWYYADNKIYVYNSTVINRIGLRGVFADPFEINSCACDDNVCFKETDTYPISIDILNSVVRDILTVELRQKITEPDEVEIDKVAAMKADGFDSSKV